MRKQGSFEFDIDVAENILCLCPTCYRKIHLAEDSQKIEILTVAYEKRITELPNRGIIIDFEELLTIYSFE